MRDYSSRTVNEVRRADACHEDWPEYYEQQTNDVPVGVRSHEVPPRARRRLSSWVPVAYGQSGEHHIANYRLWKSMIDRSLALAVLLVSAPLLVLIALIIRIDSPGNPIFAQERAGKDGRPFVIFKFRTMYVNNDESILKEWAKNSVAGNTPVARDANGKPYYKIPNDPRVTRLGSLLRKTNLDELPQVLNVLKGDMSFVGPRPEMTFATNELYSDWHRARLTATPGITGLWQVYGRGYVSFDDMVRMDIDYIQRQSLLLDAKIVLRTFGVLLGRNSS